MALLTPRAFLDGKRATADELAPLVFAGNAHFTAMQVSGGAVRGLDLHLKRLREASDELFGAHISDDRLHALLAAAIDDEGRDSSLSLFVFPGTDHAELRVLIRISSLADLTVTPVRLKTFEHERFLARFKHVGEIAKSYFKSLAQRDGFDDAAFVDSQGRLSEASIWNLAFWDGETVLWPEADVLPGVTLQILRRQLEAAGIPQTIRPLRADDLGSSLTGVVMNSWTPALRVSDIDGIRLGDGTEFAELLHRAYAAGPLTAPDGVTAVD